MDSNYTNTPSFYNNEEFFNRYLGQTSYYLGLQNIVDRLIHMIRPKRVLELGAALGTTTIMLAKKHPGIDFVGTDLRSNVVELANAAAREQKNVMFVTEDMCDTAAGQELAGFQLTFLLYSFHHILDPLEDKITFLENCYKNMSPESYLLILETFLPEEMDGIKEEQSILDLWKVRAEEGYASTYWAALQDLSSEGLAFAKKVAETSYSEEREAGDHVFRREDEYLIKFSWLKDQAAKAGFNTVIAEPVNCLNEQALLLKK